MQCLCPRASGGVVAAIRAEAGAKVSIKSRGSAQLQRWARARRARTLINQKSNSNAAGVLDREGAKSDESDRDDDRGEEEDDDRAGGKSVFMVSDGTGWTVDHSVHAALGQFEHCLTDRGCAVNTHLFSEVNDIDRLMGVIRQAGAEGAILVYTLADPAMAEAAKRACQMLAVPHLDILGPITDALGSHLNVIPLGLPRGAPGRKSTLSKQYFKRIEAVDFTIKQDDGALPQNLHKADLVLVGVSRTSKTPLSTYLAQMGYKVANVPLVLGIEAPKELFQIDQDKIYGLTIDPTFLRSIRAARYRHLGLGKETKSSYFDMEHIRTELQYSGELFKKNPTWPVIEVTGKAIEETAAVILRIYHERKNKYVIPRISKRY
ncbi:probable pyruvate, phosphate dikinase regulatory protein, chloroplastic [Selaginella moellendorffii]|nr:probable pyruvate, phosphate dikinase regulatory protein, chloroplastic [Selaginella moellendorffii]|eukprot:XP_002972853.2 probable pyruvate, phosphate dikinase regulatory protein, chloroplastic [Selaginella moellendorffii]